MNVIYQCKITCFWCYVVVLCHVILKYIGNKSFFMIGSKTGKFMELGVNFLAADNISVVLQAKLRKSIGFGIIANMHITGNLNFYQQWLALGFECTGCCKNATVPLHSNCGCWYGIFH